MNGNHTPDSWIFQLATFLMTFKGAVQFTKTGSLASKQPLSSVLLSSILAIVLKCFVVSLVSIS